MTELSIPNLSVVVPCFDAETTLEGCIESLLDQSYPAGRYEIVIVDNASSDRTADIARSYRCRVITETRRGSYAARNAGVACADGTIIAFTDADCRAHHDWLQDLCVGLGEGGVGGCAGSVESYQPTTLLERFAELKQYVSQEPPMACSYLPYAITANVAYPRDVLAELGGFDGQLRSGGDADLSWRVQRVLGLQIRFNRDAIVYHQHRQSLAQLFRQWRRYGCGTIMLHSRYPDYAAPVSTEVRRSLQRAAAFFGRGIARLARWPVQHSRDGLYFAEHFLEVGCTLSRLAGIVSCRDAVLDEIAVAPGSVTDGDQP